MTENKDLIKLWGNNEKRQAFLTAYTDWDKWTSNDETQLIWYRYQLPDGTFIIAMEHNHKTRDSLDGWKTGQPQEYHWKRGVTYYAQEPGDPFAPEQRRSISSLCELLMKAKSELQSNRKNGGDDNG